MSADQELTSLIFVPFPILSHLATAVKTAKLLADRDERLSITVLAMKLPIDTLIGSYTKNSPDARVKVVELPEDEPTFTKLIKSSKSPIFRYIESQKGTVRDAVAEIMKNSRSGRIAGFVIDMFCTAMIDVANELGVPTYMFFSSGAATLGLMFHLQSLRDDNNVDMMEYKNSDAAISIPTYVNPVPVGVWPSSVFEDSDFLDFAKRFRETKGIIVNTFLEFETHQIRSLSDDKKIPPVYPVGPILRADANKIEQENQKFSEIIRWLDKQPDSSVVFLCFGTHGCFEQDQVKEIAVALENSGHRFLWSLRKPPPKEKVEYPGEYENSEEVLPEGFLERTTETGKVIGWAPQMAVLSHPAVGGFVSHCGWNSTLESVWCGVPMAVWPLSAEQQANAFLMVKEFEMAVEIKMDYNKDSNVMVGAETIEKAIRQLMDPENEIRVKLRALKEKSRMALMEGGSSYNYLKHFVEDVVNNIS
ncbi:UDP-glucose flavonoid 3-O-glucosyltransferase 6 [Sesamum angolense]|uniref:Glycosyltransferase n=1 Tax=Sesamum angolense TaxID=2727404 RepID=A0AAE1WQX8_9LAMI|nr:UDP-glucose flavonoid 3-O-glucosyltransferase 6 [Sesamum angolense]